KNHLASTRIIGSQAYPKTKPRIYNYDTAKVGKDVNVMSYYKSNRTQAKADVEEGKRERVRRHQDKQSRARQAVRAEAPKQQTPPPTSSPSSPHQQPHTPCPLTDYPTRPLTNSHRSSLSDRDITPDRSSPVPDQGILTVSPPSLTPPPNGLLCEPWLNTKIKKYLEKYYLNHAYKVPDEFKEFLHEYP
uniref:Uncharacterized protein n=1 Tax=Anopheles melas TaxID=34690 RepID=A0A182UHX0_9DIPT